MRRYIPHAEDADRGTTVVSRAASLMAECPSSESQVLYEARCRCRLAFYQIDPPRPWRMTLVLFRRRARGEQSGAEERVGRAFEKAVRRKPLARRTRDLCKLNGARERG